MAFLEIAAQIKASCSQNTWLKILTQDCKHDYIRVLAASISTPSPDSFAP